MTISSPRQRVQSGRSPVWFEKSIEVVGDEEMDDVEELMVVDGVKEIDLVMDRGVLVVTSMIDQARSSQDRPLPNRVRGDRAGRIDG